MSFNHNNKCSRTFLNSPRILILNACKYNTFSVVDTRCRGPTLRKKPMMDRPSQSGFPSGGLRRANRLCDNFKSFLVIAPTRPWKLSFSAHIRWKVQFIKVGYIDPWILWELSQIQFDLNWRMRHKPWWWYPFPICKPVNYYYNKQKTLRKCVYLMTHVLRLIQCSIWCNFILGIENIVYFNALYTYKWFCNEVHIKINTIYRHNFPLKWLCQNALLIKTEWFKWIF